MAKDFRSDVEFNNAATVVGNLTASAGTTTLGTASVISTSSVTVPFTIKAAVSQSANLQEWKGSGGTALSYVRNDGMISAGGSGILTGTIRPPAFSSGGRINLADANPIIIDTSASTIVPLVAKGASGQTANLQQWQNSSGTILSRVKSDGTLQIGTETVTTREYVQSRGMNLIANGTGALGTNYNFTSASTLFTDVPAGAKLSYYSASGVQGAVVTDELIPVDPSKTYRGTISVKQLGTASNSQFYAYAAAYDIDSNGIFPATSYINPSTQTTLAQNLNVGDTVVYLTSTTNWTTVNGYLAVYGYKNSYGYQYPDYTYTQIYKSISTITASNNSITLSSAWSGASAAASTAAANTLAAGTYKYFITVGIIPSASSWTTYVGEIGGISPTNGWETTKFPAATAFIKIGWLSNYAPNTASSFMAVGGISLSEVSTGNLKVFDAKLTGDYSASWFQVKDSSRLNVPTLNVDLTNSRVGINISSPSAALHSVAYSSAQIPLIVQGATSQSADLTQWKNSSASVLANISANGGLNISSGSISGSVIATQTWVQAQGYGFGGGTTITTSSTSFTSPSIVSASVLSTTIPIGKTFILSRLTTNIPARIRLYADTATRDADVSRAVGTSPTGNHGLILEIVTSGILDYYISPAVTAYVSSSSVPINITNLSASSSSVIINLTRSILEQ